jgi:hypothetical protein
MSLSADTYAANRYLETALAAIVCQPVHIRALYLIRYQASVCNMHATCIADCSNINVLSYDDRMPDPVVHKHAWPRARSESRGGPSIWSPRECSKGS